MLFDIPFGNTWKFPATNSCGFGVVKFPALNASNGVNTSNMHIPQTVETDIVFEKVPSASSSVSPSVSSVTTKDTKEDWSEDKNAEYINARKRADSFQQHRHESDDDFQSMKNNVRSAVDSLHIYDVPLSPSDKVMVMQGWNKVLAFKSAFSEALWLYWRILVASSIESEKQAMALVEDNEDPLARCMMERSSETEELLMGLIDGVLRSMCPAQQHVLREAYRPLQDDVHLRVARGDGISLECESPEDYFKLFARCGVLPEYWVLFCEAFLWALRTHTPYAQEDDKDELERGSDSAFTRAIAQLVALPAIKAYKFLKSLSEDFVYKEAVPRMWSKLTTDDRMNFGENFYRTLLTKHADLLDYFSKTDMDSLIVHFVASLDLVVSSASELGSSDGRLRRVLGHLGELHRTIGVPTYAYAMVGATLIDCLEPIFEQEEEATKSTPHFVTTKQLRGAFLTLYTEIMSMIYYPMLRHEKQVEAAREFYEHLQSEFQWTDAQLSRRMQEVEQEIGASGTYTQTSEELEMGARLAWRNSAKCIGRISWNTLVVRDCRHVDTPAQIFHEVQEHLKLATAGTNIQSVMTVFKPKDQDEPFGTRFWSSQYVRYAAYTDEITGALLGDPANLDLTEYLLKNKYWTPPFPRTAFDVLPLVLKMPGKERPYVYQLPQEYVYEVSIEHPGKPEISALGYRWSTVPAISNFKMNLGGVLYQNMPFNGWFMSTEIVRNLMERYDAGATIGKLMGLDMATDPAWRQVVASELERAVVHSFQKRGFTIVDPHTVGESFCTHVRREREQFGRECPAQWSWIGGMVGPTNPTWHMEMRDFLVKPQYDYCAEGLLLHTSVDLHSDNGDDESVSLPDESSRNTSVPRVLIAYGSETGNAESIARKLKRQLKVLKPLLFSLNDVAGLECVARRGITHVICICSTFGKGDPPSNASDFFDVPIENTLGTKFAVLALGSTLYPDFCHAGILLNKKLLRSGMEVALRFTTADAAAGADAVITDWVSNIKKHILPPSLENELLAWKDVVCDDPPVNQFVWEEDTVPDEESSNDKDAAFVTCVGNVDLIECDGKDSRQVKKVTFKVPKGSSYESGDHLSIIPMNSDAMVVRFLKCFEEELVGYAKTASSGPDATLDSAAAFEWKCRQTFQLECIEGEESSPSDVFFKTPASLFEITKSSLDLSIGPKDVSELLKMLEGCLDDMLLRLGDEKRDALAHPLVLEFIRLSAPITESSSSDKTDFIDASIAQFPTIVNFLEHFKELFLEDFVATKFGREAEGPILKLPEMLVIMSRLQPRYYSISSTARTSPTEVSITVGVLKTSTSRRVPIEGVCSHYLSSLRPGIDKAKVTIAKSSFRLPENKKAPLIMVGAGTGLAPLMGFMEDREVDRDNGHNVGSVDLFFGCRTDSHFLYKEAITTYAQEGLIDLHLALSRAPNTPHRYVQHHLAEMGHAASELLMNRDTHYYVCGDARMADSCFEACVELLRKHQTMSRVKAVKHLRDMRVEGRWQTDVWGIVSHYEESKKAIEKNKKMAAKIWLTHFREDD